MAAVGAIVAACKSAPEAPPPPPDSRMPSTNAGQAPGRSALPSPSAAISARAYRRDAATHVYNLNP